MHKAVHAADVDERAEVRQTANDALDHAADFQRVPDSLFALGFLSQKHLFARSDDALLGLVHFDDLQGQLLAHELLNLLHIAQRELGGGDEAADAHHVGQQAALDGFLAGAGDILAGLVLGDDLVPDLAVDDVALRKQHVAFAVVDLDDFDFDLVANLYIGRGEVSFLNQSVCLVTDVDADLVIGDLHHGARDRLPGTELYHGLFHIRHEVGFGGIGLGLLLLGRSDLLLDVVHSCCYLLNCTIRRRGAGCNPDSVRRVEPRIFHLARALDEVRTRTDRPDQLEQLAAVGAFPAAHHQHHICALCQLDGFLLPLARGGADGPAYLQIAHALPESRAYALKTFEDECGLRNGQRALHFRQRAGAFHVGHGVAFAARPAADALHLRVMGFAHHDQRHALRLRLLRHFMDARDEGTGGVAHLTRARAQARKRFPAHAMRTHHGHRALGDVLRRIGADHAHVRQFPHHPRVVDHRPERPGRGRFPGGFHRSAHAETESGMFRHDHVGNGDSPSPFVCVSKIR